MCIENVFCKGFFWRRVLKRIILFDDLGEFIFKKIVKCSISNCEILIVIDKDIL